MLSLFHWVSVLVHFKHFSQTDQILQYFLELSFFFQQGNQTLAALKLVTDIWFICDMMLNFRTGVFRYHIRKVLEMDPTEIRRLYIKGWFFIDLIATFPFDVFFDLILLGSTEVRSAQESIEWC